ncbi:preprotein translocase subunit SecE [Ancrocorticia populi]|uniref:Protein translocase subunit SecE n=1 Tax=Ancrocorticia populi TaxID=2175228 RepID=A0A2V1KAE9_9ACTO|nr:preprotein translocase subunit SecE [Ancrocorticia populi]MDN6486247.1 preprotein translocase subunit SecE [Ancrocorticia sp.]PWF27435.1 preprotein translocase subunit SecE [Ancrocorticia populi]
MNAASRKNPADAKLGFFGRIALYIRQIFGELKKVQRPSRSELWQMFLTVILFVAVVMVFVGLLDAAFSQLSLWIFG